MSVAWRRSLAFVAVLGIGSFLTMQSNSNGQLPVGAAEKKVQQWEYRMERSVNLEHSRANDLGKDGWELVAIDRMREGQMHAVFKRPL